MSTNCVAMPAVSRINVSNDDDCVSKKVAYASTGACIGGFLGAIGGSYLTSDKFIKTVAQHAANKQNLRVALEKDFRTVFDKNGKTILSEQRFNKFMAKLGENPAKIGKIALASVVGLASIGALIGYFVGRKND